MPGPNPPEVLIVGAGPVGLLTALSLAQRGIRVQIIDKEWRTGAHSYALALQPQSLRLMEELGLRDRVLQGAYPVRTIGLYDGTARADEIRLAEPGDAASCLAVMRQDVLENLLEQTLRGLGVPVSWNHQLSELTPLAERVGVTVDKLEKDSVGYAVARTEWIVARSTSVDVPFVVGTDGHRSGVRRALALDFHEVAPAQHYAVFEFRSNFDLDHEMRIVLGAQTTDVLWPLPGDHCRWSFQLSDFAAPERTRVKDRLAIHLGGTPYPVLAEEGLRHLIAQRAPWFTGSIDEVTWRIVVRFEHRLSDGFGRGRVWLAGDAAHMTGPVGMQSMNVGLFEAHDLAGILARILRQRSTADELAAYERRWMGVWRQLLGLEGGLRPQPQADPWASRCADRLLACLPAHGAELTAMAAQLRLQG